MCFLVRICTDSQFGAICTPTSTLLRLQCIERSDAQPVVGTNVKEAVSLTNFDHHFLGTRANVYPNEDHTNLSSVEYILSKITRHIHFPLNCYSKTIP